VWPTTGPPTIECTATSPPPPNLMRCGFCFSGVRPVLSPLFFESTALLTGSPVVAFGHTFSYPPSPLFHPDFFFRCFFPIAKIQFCPCPRFPLRVISPLAISPPFLWSPPKGRYFTQHFLSEGRRLLAKTLVNFPPILDTSTEDQSLLREATHEFQPPPQFTCVFRRQRLLFPRGRGQPRRVFPSLQPLTWTPCNNTQSIRTSR